MSTVVDKIVSRRARTSSGDMRVRVLAAAGKAFSRMSYDAIGVREIAALADTDPAIVIRLFGSKASLFAAVAENAFGEEAVFQGPLEDLGARLARHLMSPFTAREAGDEVDDFQLLLRSATSLVAAPILSAALHRALIEPLGARIGKANGAARAALLAAQVLGFATLRFALGSSVVEADGAAMERLLAASLQRCIKD